MRTSTLVLLVLLPFTGCVTGQDDPTTVRDLRVLGMGFEPPEVLIKSCNALTLRALVASQRDGGTVENLDPRLLIELVRAANLQLEFKALIADPAGAGRTRDKRFSVCTDVTDRTCSIAEKRVLITEGQYDSSLGELVLRFSPAAETTSDGGVVARNLSNGTSALLDVIQNDQYRGLGGLRLPIVMELTAPDSGEKIFAQKLMPYVCRFLPQMEQNILPVLPGMTAKGEPWERDQVIELSGREAIDMEPLDFSSLEETYVLPSLMLEPVTLTESWKIAHYASSGTMSPYETGGTNIGGTESKPTFKWSPDATQSERDVQFYFVVRDGRGGESWITRQAHWKP